MRPRQLRQQCRQIISALDVPAPFSVHRLCESVAVTRGRPIDLRAVAMPPDTASGVWVSTRTNDYIFYEERTTPLHQEHIILHELGHLLGDHGTDAPLLAEATQVLLPDLDPELVNRMLNRTAYTAEEERMAETIASMILEAANRWKPVSDWEAPAHGADVRQRVHLTIDPQTPRRPR